VLLSPGVEAGWAYQTPLVGVQCVKAEVIARARGGGAAEVRISRGRVGGNAATREPSLIGSGCDKRRAFGDSGGLGVR